MQSPVVCVGMSQDVDCSQAVEEALEGEFGNHCTYRPQAKSLAMSLAWSGLVGELLGSERC